MSSLNRQSVQFCTFFCRERSCELIERLIYYSKRYAKCSTYKRKRAIVTGNNYSPLICNAKLVY